MSQLADDVYDNLKKIYPFDCIIKEHYVFYNNTRLFFDFYIKTLNILIECQGEQHFKYNSHFHSDIKSFYAQKRRDNLKVEYCTFSNTPLVYFYDKKDTITPNLILNRIYEALNE
jgi:hypothetical protein